MSALRAAARIPAKALIFLIELYRTYISPTRMPVCRFTPTCSEYAVTALRTRGLVVGLGLTAVRLAKCAPWHPGGWDPVPERKSARKEQLRDGASAYEGSSSAVTGDTNDGSA
ncbi:membrane protein insertion efficiency factor YidD [Nocardia sp. 2]|uniref:Putative membrane protein insertion efficiency factor n=1 Tax=Nocardia acididurans TaxID=2802282 RepID=A0ABS1M281_9NOCA|nr:membrane protein insertion efficiency factor YidD [Nocardia acididurans]MBL1073238.1 membrane protein insertion efficiency factor YidD [Nocardia acididurans]